SKSYKTSVRTCSRSRPASTRSGRPCCTRSCLIQPCSTPGCPGWKTSCEVGYEELRTPSKPPCTNASPLTTSTRRSWSSSSNNWHGGLTRRVASYWSNTIRTCFK
ncbi:MAG: hypothetical protein ACK56I_22890, partial [bacterium]